MQSKPERTTRLPRATASRSSPRSQEVEQAVTELSVGTKKGLFLREGEPGGEFAVSGRAFAGEPVEYALRDPRTGRLFAAVTNAFYGSKVFYADEPESEWQQAQGIALPE